MACKANKAQRSLQIQAVKRDAEQPNVGQVLATGALAAVIAAGSLLPAPAMAADLALGKQVFEGRSGVLLANWPCKLLKNEPGICIDCCRNLQARSVAKHACQCSCTHSRGVAHSSTMSALSCSCAHQAAVQLFAVVCS